MPQKYKVFVNEEPIIVASYLPKQSGYTIFELKAVNFRKIVKKVLKGSLTSVWLYHHNADKLQKQLHKKLGYVEAAGGFVINKAHEALFIFRNGKWDLPKGGIEKNETPEAAALREVEEETGCKQLEIIELLGETYHVFDKGSRMKLKHTYWYLMHSDYEGKLTPQESEGIRKALWCNEIQTIDALKKSYANIRDLMPLQVLKRVIAD